MTIDELKKMAYMEGFIEDFLDDAYAKLTEAGSVKHADELKTAWLVLTAGIAKLRQENQTMQHKLAGVHSLLDT